MNAYVLCENCSIVHYVIDATEFHLLDKAITDSFSKRNLKYCFGCGKKDKFKIIPEKDIDSYLSGADIPPLYIENPSK